MWESHSHKKYPPPLAAQISNIKLRFERANMLNAGYRFMSRSFRNLVSGLLTFMLLLRAQQ